MANSSIKLRAKLKRGETPVKALISHPMETGKRKDKKTGELVPAHFIQEVICSRNGETALEMEWNATVSKNPYISFTLEGGAKGDEITLSWKDNLGNTDSKTAKVR